MSIFTFIGSLPKELEEDVTSIFNKSKAAYEKLAPELQAAIKNGSGIWAAICADKTGNAGTIVADIIAKFGISDAELLTVEQSITKAFNLASADTTTDLTTTLQAYAKSLDPNIWPDISNAIAGIASTALNGGNIITIGLSVVKYVYEDVVKPLFG